MPKKSESIKDIWLYHGTSNLDSIVNEGFKPELTGAGNDQLGSGFYFTTDRTEASGYAFAVTGNVPRGEQKTGGDSSPGVFLASLDITNPLVIDGNSLNDAPINITQDQAFKILMAAPGIFDVEESPIGNWFEIHAARPVTPAMVRKVAANYTGKSMIFLEGDFFRGESGAFRSAARDFLGFDGVVHKLKDGHSHYVAWFSEQIEPLFLKLARAMPSGQEIPAPTLERP